MIFLKGPFKQMQFLDVPSAGIQVLKFASLLRQVLVRQLRQLAFPYKWRVGISTPIFWACLDIAPWHGK